MPDIEFKSTRAKFTLDVDTAQSTFLPYPRGKNNVEYKKYYVVGVSAGTVEVSDTTTPADFITTDLGVGDLIPYEKTNKEFFRITGTTGTVTVYMETLS